MNQALPKTFGESLTKSAADLFCLHSSVYSRDFAGETTVFIKE